MSFSNLDRDLADQQAVDERDNQTALICGKVCATGRSICIDCDKQISPARLKVAPFAQRCIYCQTLKEKHA